MMGVGEAAPAPREPASPVPGLQGPSQGRGDGAGSAPHVQDGAVGGLGEADDAGVAAEAPGRFMLKRGCRRPVPIWGRRGLGAGGRPSPFHLKGQSKPAMWRLRFSRRSRGGPTPARFARLLSGVLGSCETSWPILPDASTGSHGLGSWRRPERLRLHVQHHLVPLRPAPADGDGKAGGGTRRPEPSGASPTPLRRTFLPSTRRTFRLVVRFLPPPPSPEPRRQGTLRHQPQGVRPALCRLPLRLALQDVPLGRRGLHHLQRPPFLPVQGVAGGLDGPHEECPSSAVRRPRTTYIPSSSGKTERVRAW
jgi:hypothetical protein